jgi:hypothetical protein
MSVLGDDLRSGWNDHNFAILERMRKNCVLYSKLHRHEFLSYQKQLKYFKVPVIFFSAINSVVSVGLTDYLPQNYISVTSCGLALLCGIITSVELYLGINSSMTNELEKSKEFYLLSVKLFKELALDIHQRADCKTFLEQSLAEYLKLIENSNITSNKIQEDCLQPLPRDLPSVVGDRDSRDSGEII